MEGDDCYKFSTLSRFLERTRQRPVCVAIDVGCNVGEMTVLMRHFFPSALIFALEPIPDYYSESCRALSADVRVKVLCLALTSQHEYADDVGYEKLPAPSSLKAFLGLPHAGPGWRGGSRIRASSEPPLNDGYAPLDIEVPAVTFNDLVDAVCALSGRTEVDYVKMDCEGCENSALGCAGAEALRRVRYLSGEYHDLGRFKRVIQRTLYQTHHVNIVGEDWGSFFAERRDSSPSLLSAYPTDELRWASSEGQVVVDRHSFKREYVLQSDYWSHGL